MKIAGRSQGSSQKESPQGEGGVVCTAGEEEQEREVDLALLPSEGLLESPHLSGPPNPWRHSDLKMLSPHLDMTITQLTGGPPNPMERNLVRGLHRAVEKDHVDLDLQGPQGKINPLALGG